MLVSVAAKTIVAIVITSLVAIMILTHMLTIIIIVTYSTAI